MGPIAVGSSGIGIPSSWAQAIRIFASGTISVAPLMTPLKTSPVLPSIVMASPVSSTRSPTTTRPSSTTSIPAAPTTAGIPHPRATTAA